MENTIEEHWKSTGLLEGVEGKLKEDLISTFETTRRTLILLGDKKVGQHISSLVFPIIRRLHDSKIDNVDVYKIIKLLLKYIDEIFENNTYKFTGEDEEAIEYCIKKYIEYNIDSDTMIAKNTIDSEVVHEKYCYYFTVGELKKFINDNNIPNDGKILIGRVKDSYFNTYGWETIKKKGFEYGEQLSLINKAKSGVYNDKEKYPKVTDEYINNIIESEKYIDNLLDEYVVAWCAVKYKDDNKNLYITPFY